MATTSKRMICLLSPAKTLDMSTAANFLASQPHFQHRCDELVTCLHKLSKTQLKNLLSVSDNIAALNHERYQGFSAQPAKQCALAYDGPAYRGLTASSFDDKSQERAQESIRILSGLYGILRPFDQIQPYRLDMGKKLRTGKDCADLYGYWGSDIAEKVLADLGESGGTIVNCASQEYFKAVQKGLAELAPLPAGVHVVTCAFPGPSVYAKRARGMMCRFVVENSANVGFFDGPGGAIDGLKHFEGYGDDRYHFSETQSDESQLVFLRGAASGSGGGAGKATGMHNKGKGAGKGAGTGKVKGKGKKRKRT